MFAFVADLFTFSRLIAAALLIWLGFQGPGTLRAAILVIVIAWTTDQLDGWAARRARTPTHLAPYDFAIDTCLYVATLAYLTLAGFLPAVPVLIFALVALIAAVAVRRKAVQIACIRLIDLALAVVIFSHEPLIGLLLVFWLVCLAVIYRRRLLQRVPRWFAEMARLLGLKGKA